MTSPAASFGNPPPAGLRKGGGAAVFRRDVTVSQCLSSAERRVGGILFRDGTSRQRPVTFKSLRSEFFARGIDGSEILCKFTALPADVSFYFDEREVTKGNVE